MARKASFARRAASLIVWLAAGAAAIYLALGWFSAPNHPGWRLLPDDRGSIRHVVCVVNTARRARLRNAALVTEIVNTLPEDVRVTILTNDRRALIVANNPWPRRVELVDLPPEADFTIWPQDPFLVLTDGAGHCRLVASKEFSRADDRLIAECLSKRFGWPLQTSKFSFEGGNIVSGSRHVFVGAETIRLNALRLEIADAEVVRRMSRELGRPVVVLGPLPQPVGHIDMMLTPLGPQRLVLADTRWGARMAREQLRTHPEAVERFERYCERYYFGHPEIRELNGPNGRVILPPRVLGQTEEAIKASEAIAGKLDRLAAELKQFGYRIERMPMLAGIMPPDESALPEHRDKRSQPARPRGDTDSRRQRPARLVPVASAQPRLPPGDLSDPGRVPVRAPGFPCLTYNNVLLEHQADGRWIVYLPQYGFEAMDQEARQAWEKLGCRVVPVEGLAISAMYGGALRCCVKVVKRSYPAE